MVESDYNYYTPYEGNIICMNGVTGTVFTVTKNEYDLMKKIMQNADLQGIYSELTHKLIKTRFLTTNMDDEKEYLYLANLHTSFLCNLIYPTFSRILLYSC